MPGEFTIGNHAGNITTFIHEVDYTGEVEIRQAGKKLTVPFAALKAFIADAVRKQIIAEVEQQDDDEILGVEQLGDESELEE